MYIVIYIPTYIQIIEHKIFKILLVILPNLGMFINLCQIVYIGKDVSPILRYKSRIMVKR